MKPTVGAPRALFAADPCVCLRAWAVDSAHSFFASRDFAGALSEQHVKIGPFLRSRAISTPPTGAERTRFRNLLELANSSEYDGERANALDAARRIAARHGMTLEEAARTGLEPRTPLSTSSSDRRSDPRATYFAYAQQEAMAREKRHWEDAVRRARERGLDRADSEITPRGEPRPRRWSQTRRDPQKHAAVLLQETSLPFREIADITGLDIYAVVGMKLKMRAVALT